MADLVDGATRSRMMSGIRGKDTRPELMVRRRLHADGFRFRLHLRDLPGNPDIVLLRHRAVVMIHGCFWHRHSQCRYSTSPKTRPEFWQAKFESNVARDAKNYAELMALGWRVATVWECALKSDPTNASDNLTQWLLSGETTITIG